MAALSQPCSGANADPIDHVFPLVADRGSASALNFYAEQAAAFDGESLDTGSLVATCIALAWNTLRRNEQFRSAIASRDVIGQAKGIVMERFNLDGGGSLRSAQPAFSADQHQAGQHRPAAH